MEILLNDVRYALLLMRKSPGFTLVVILTLALGIGANTAMFSIVNGVLLRPLPFHDPDQLVRIYFDAPGVGLHDIRFAEPELEDLQKRAGVFEDVSVVFPSSTNLTGAENPERLELLGTNTNYFSMLGVTPEIGRLLGEQDWAPGFGMQVVISDSL